jgi:hypothetical protein
MTLSNGSIALAADMNAAASTQLGLIQDDNEQLPGAYELHLQWRDVVAGTSSNAYRAKYVFVCPFDSYLETFAVSGGDHTAASTLAAAITGDGTLIASVSNSDTIGDEGQLVFWPTKVSGTAGAGATKLARLLFDGTKTKSDLAFATTNRAHRTLLKGSTLTVSVSSSSVATASLVTVALVLREFFARE